MRKSGCTKERVMKKTAVVIITGMAVECCTSDCSVMRDILIKYD